MLNVDDDTTSTQVMTRTIPSTLQWDENFEVGADTGTPVNDRDYSVPFRSNGNLAKLTGTINRTKLAPQATKKLR